MRSTVYVLSTIPTWYLVDIWGRRPILLSGSLVMAFALSSVGYFLYLDKSYTPNAVVVSVIVFNAFFGYSWGPVPWLYPPEILPLAFRVKGVSLSTATNWAFNFIVSRGAHVPWVLARSTTSNVERTLMSLRSCVPTGRRSHTAVTRSDPLEAVSHACRILPHLVHLRLLPLPRDDGRAARGNG